MENLSELPLNDVQLAEIVRATNQPQHAATKKSNQAPGPRPVLLVTWSLDPKTGKPIGRWIVEAPDLALATAATQRALLYA